MNQRWCRDEEHEWLEREGYRTCARCGCCQEARWIIWRNRPIRVWVNVRKDYDRIRRQRRLTV